MRGRIFVGLVFAVSVVVILIVQELGRAYAPDGFSLDNNSDDRAQTLPIAQLKREPLRSLLYLHIQPPLLDGLRALISQFFDDTPSGALLRGVDSVLYVLWAVVGGFGSVLVFLWLRTTVPIYFALVFALIWTFHPSIISIASLLDSTLISGIGTTWLCYELWRIHLDRQRSLWPLMTAFLLLFFTRTVYQWYFVVVLLTALVMVRGNLKGTLRPLMTALFIMAVYLAKQLYLFGTLSTTSYAGYHLCGLIWHRPSAEEVERANSGLTYQYPIGAKEVAGDFYMLGPAEQLANDYSMADQVILENRTSKKAFVNGEYNHEKTCRDNLIYSEICLKRIFTSPLESISMIGRSFIQNIKRFILATAYYSRNYVHWVMPWQKTYMVFSWGVNLVLLVFAALAVWAYRNLWRSRDWRCLKAQLGISLVIIYAFLIVNLGNRYGWVESNRLKFLIEPTIYVFVVTQFVMVLKGIFSLVRRKDDSANV